MLKLKTQFIMAPVYTIGDARQVGKAQEAIHDAYELAQNL
jgi:hypothetical protein